MVVEKSIVLLRYKTNGIYELGGGWVREGMADIWDEYMECIDDCRVTVIKPEYHGEGWRLATTYSCTYIHPRGNLLYLRDKFEVEVMKEHINGVVHTCGGEVSFNTQEVKFELEI